MTMYVGPERRRKVRRTYDKGGAERECVSQHGDTRTLVPHTHVTNRRSGSDRRQQALSGVVSGLSAEQMEMLTSLWRMMEKDDARRGIMK